MIRVLERLRDDHRHAAKLINILSQELEKISTHENADLELMRDVMFYLVRFNDKVHHPCEDLLYARMTDRVRNLSKEFSDLGSEHNNLIHLGGKLAETFSVIVDGGLTLREEVITRGNEYVRELLQHMSREENKFFPLIEQHLTASDSEEVFKILDAARDPIFGPILDADFKDLYNHIQSNINN
jgi:hemerythrin-like domain-containing protein